MRKRLRSWFGRPAAGSSGADVLRWVRRLSIATGIAGVLLSVLLGLLGMDLWWVLAALGAANLLDALVLMRRRISRLESQPEPPRPAPEALAQRKRRAMATMIVFYVLGGGFGGLVAGGAPGLLVGAIIGGLGALCGLWLSRHWSRG